MGDKHIVTGIRLKTGQKEEELLKIAEKELGAKPAYFRLLKKSLDARDKNDIRWVYSFEFSFDAIGDRREKERLPENKMPSLPVVIAGSGPCGLFAAVRLIERGIKPIVVERGDCVEKRIKKTEDFAMRKIFDPECNIQFGEGGAGTFSDGKLNTQTHSGYNGEVLDTFVRFGAPEEILYLSKPHIGSDNLKKIVAGMRHFIENNGGKVLFRTKLDDVRISDGKISSVTLKNGDKTETFSPYALVLAVGHSARDTFGMLKNRAVAMKAKDFAVGVRIEHLQEKISFAQYGKEYVKLPPADYKLVSHAADRAAFTFCMCPGGYVMPASGETGCVVTNGMSNYARDGKNADSALIVPVGKRDFKSDDVLAGVEFQRTIERKAFARSGDYSAPVQRVEDFLSGRATRAFGEVYPTYPGVCLCKTDGILPECVIGVLKAAIPDMNKRLKGFASPDALLTFAESRTSSPVRIERDELMVSPLAHNLYPCGEGAGYAGGIMSSAADGLRVAEAIYRRLLN